MLGFCFGVLFVSFLGFSLQPLKGDWFSLEIHHKFYLLSIKVWISVCVCFLLPNCYIGIKATTWYPRMADGTRA